MNCTRTNFFEKFREDPADRSNPLGVSNKKPASFIPKIFKNQTSGPSPLTSSIAAKFRWERIGLTTDKPVPPEDITHAIDTINLLEASLTNLIKILKPLINDADIALRTTPRPACHPNCGNCEGLGLCYQDAKEIFDRVIEAGGPMCFLQTKYSNPRLLPAHYSHLQLPCKINACPSSNDHDHLHITNSHRVLLENMKSQADYLSAMCSRLALSDWAYRRIPLRLDSKRQSSQDQNIVEKVQYWNDINKVKLEYEWVWVGTTSYHVNSWEDLKAACNEVTEMKDARIGEFNLRILIKNELALVSKPIRKKKRLSWSMEGMIKKPRVSALSQAGRQRVPTPPQPEWEVSGASHERCEGCDENIEITRKEREAEAARRAAERAGGRKHPKLLKPHETSEFRYCMTKEERLQHRAFQKLEQVFARTMQIVTRPEPLTDKTGRFTAKAKGKWRCKEAASAAEESVLYNRNFVPTARELCAWCREQKRLAERAAEATRMRRITVHAAV